MPKETLVFRIDGSAFTTEPTADFIGGKALSLYRMKAAGFDVPPAIVIPCAVSLMDRPSEFMSELKDQVAEGMAWIEKTVGRKCLFSVRSGAPISMPGMMDTILNVGLNPENFSEFKTLLGGFGAADSQRRLLQMYGTTLGLPAETFETIFKNCLRETGDVSAKACTDAVGVYVDIEPQIAAFHPLGPVDQVMTCVSLVFDSWFSPRAVDYRKINKISDTLGTAVVIQAMVYGNLNEYSGSGVLFTRNPSTGEPGMVGEFLERAQGEDVVSGTRTPRDVLDMLNLDNPWPGIYKQLTQVCIGLESMYGDMVDIEFTVEKGKLYILQSRKGKRTPRAAVRIAADLLLEGNITVGNLSKYLSVDEVLASVGSSIVSTGTAALWATGLPAGGGVVRGIATFTIEDAIAEAGAGKQVVLIREETLPEDIAAMSASVAIVTLRGGATCHAAVVSRAMNKACVVGIGKFAFTIAHGAKVVVDGDNGKVWVDDGSIVVSEGSTKDIEKIAATIAIKDGVALRYNVPIPGVMTVIPMADLLFSDSGADQVKLVKDVGGDLVVFEQSPPTATADVFDKDIWELLRPVVDANCVSVRKMLDTHGVPVIAEPKTVSDAFSGKPVLMTDSFVKNVIGGKVMLKKLEKAFGPVKGVPTAVDPYELIVAKLGCGFGGLVGGTEHSG